MNIDLERLVQFYHVAETNSFARAAQRLGIDPARLTKQIKRLESRLGFLLFDRSDGGLTLTPEGSEFFRNAHEVTDAAKRVRSVARSLSEGKRDEIILGICDSSFWVPARQNLMDRIASDCPEIAINPVVRTSTELIGALGEREIDVGIVGIVRDMRRFDYLTIHRSRPVMLIPPGHALAELPTLRMSDVRGLDIAIPIIDNDYSFEMIYAPFLNAGAVPHWVPEGALAAIHAALVKKICVVGWGFEHTVNTSLHCREVRDCDAVIEVVVAKNTEDDREIVQKFWSVVQSVASELEELAAISRFSFETDL
jgi:DNA-binding transcriptional LysR family regulator